jgi:hypothetical protein
MKARMPLAVRLGLAVLGPVAALLGVLGTVTGQTVLSTVAVVVFVILCLPWAFRADERLGLNLARAGRNAYFAFVVAFVGVVLWLRFVPDLAVAENGLFGLFFATALAFGGSFIYYERRGV